MVKDLSAPQFFRPSLVIQVETRRATRTIRMMVTDQSVSTVVPCSSKCPDTALCQTY